MRKHIRLNISTPCDESWDKMVAAEKGKFCSSCQKHVIDFTRMDDAQLVAYFRKPPTGSVCGRFMQDQLDRNMEIPKKRIPWVKYFFQFALPAFLVTAKGYSQGKVRTIEGRAIPIVKVKGETRKDLSINSSLKNHQVIKGRIMNDDHESIPYATVLIKGTTSVTVADSSGFFELIYRGNKDEIVLSTSCIGFETKEISVNTRDSEKLQTITIQSNAEILDELKVLSTLETSCSFVLGGIRLSDKHVDEINTLDTSSNIVYNIFSKIFSSESIIKGVYPNPLKGNSLINIKLGKHKGDMYSIELMNLAGQLILSREEWIDKGADFVGIHIPDIASGTYLIRLVNRRSGKNNTEKLIIE